jgi:hypothetical protein
MAATKTELAVPPSHGRSVSIDHTFNEPRSIAALMSDLERALSTMRPDDLLLEIDSHTDVIAPLRACASVLTAIGAAREPVRRAEL